MFKLTDKIMLDELEQLLKGNSMVKELMPRTNDYLVYRFCPQLLYKGLEIQKRSQKVLNLPCITDLGSPSSSTVLV